MNVHLGYCHPGEVTGGFMLSVLDAYADPDLGLVYPPHAIMGGVNVQDHRNQIVADFMETDGEWLLFLDSDMSIGVGGLRRLFASADPDERPVVGGLCFKLDPTVMSGDTRALHYATAATMWTWNEINGEWGYRRAVDYSRDTLVEVKATGAACLLIHRSVFDKLDPAPFSLLYEPEMRTVLSEDMSFCRRCNLANIPIYVNTGVRTAHAKTFYVDERFHRKHVVNSGIPDIVVTGTGRCGTMFTAETLKHCGIASTHETVFTADGVKLSPDIQVDSSWMAAATLTDEATVPRVVVHQVRNPNHVIQSFTDMAFPNDPVYGKMYDFAQRHAPQSDDLTDLQAAVKFYCDWIELIEESDTVDYVVKVEEWWDRYPDIVRRELGIEISDARREWATKQVSAGMNSRSGLHSNKPVYSWQQMLTAAKEVGAPLTAIANRYNYTQKELNSGRR